MTEEQLISLTKRFAAELPDSTGLQDRQAAQKRRVRRATKLLTPDRIRHLSESDLRELFFDTTAFDFWQDKEGEFTRRRERVGLDGLKATLQFLIERASDGLTPADLKEIQSNTGLGLLLATELAAYRFPRRCWVYSAGATPRALHTLGYNLKAPAPRGQKSDAFLYAAARIPVEEIRKSLAAAGFHQPDYLLVDLFLSWVRLTVAPRQKRAMPRRKAPRPVLKTEQVRERPQSYRTIDPQRMMIAALTAEGLVFSPWQIAAFYTALQVKGFVILSGISGTGKTRLAQRFAALLDPESESQPADRTVLFVPVRPDWRDSKSLLGYFNPLTAQYEWTPFLRFLARATASFQEGDGRAWFALLDEMNLARVEYYFADLLSILESGRDETGWTREALQFVFPADARGDLPPRELRLPPNLYFVGTVNTDETTHAFSPKVLDRAFSLPLSDVDLSRKAAATDGAPPTPAAREALREQFTLGGQFTRVDQIGAAVGRAPEPEIVRRLQVLNDLLRPHHLHFGYRVFDEIVAFLSHARQNRLMTKAEAFDAAILMKTLPKFHGSRGRLERPLRSMLAWLLNPDDPDHLIVDKALRAVETGGAAEVARAIERDLSHLNYICPVTAARVREMLHALYTEGFAAFA